MIKQSEPCDGNVPGRHVVLGVNEGLDPEHVTPELRWKEWKGGCIPRGEGTRGGFPGRRDVQRGVENDMIRPTAGSQRKNILGVSGRST